MGNSMAIHFVAKRGLQELAFSLATEAPTDINLPDRVRDTLHWTLRARRESQIVKILLPGWSRGTPYLHML